MSTIVVFLSLHPRLTPVSHPPITNNILHVYYNHLCSSLTVQIPQPFHLFIY